MSEGNAPDEPHTLPPVDEPATLPDFAVSQESEADGGTPEEPTHEGAVEGGDPAADSAGYIIEIRRPTHQPGDRTFHMLVAEWERVCAADPLPFEVELCTPAGEPVDPASGAKRALRLSTVERCVLCLVPAQREALVETPREEVEGQPAIEPKSGRRGRR